MGNIASVSKSQKENLFFAYHCIVPLKIEWKVTSKESIFVHENLCIFWMACSMFIGKKSYFDMFGMWENSKKNFL